MFLGSAFWSPFNFLKSNVDELLNKENLQLEDILDDENILTDLKSNNDKFGKYLQRHPQFVKSLVDYIIKEPIDEEMDFKICYKYPFVSSEILGCEIVGLIKAFFEDAQDGDSHLSFSKNFDQDESNGNIKDQEKEFEGNEDEKKLSTPKKKVLETLKEEIGQLNISSEKTEMVGIELLDYLLSFLDNPEKYLNQTLTGYFQKAINAILNKRGFDMLNHIFDKFDIVKKMIYHCINKSIAEILVRVLFIDIPFIDAKMTLFLEQRKDIMTLLLESFEKTDDYEEADNISFIFCDLISKYKNVNAGRELIESLNTPKTLNILLNKLFCKESSIISSSCNIIISLLMFFMNRDTEPSSLNESLKSPLKEAKPQTIISVQPIYTNFFQMIEKHVELLIKALNIDNLIPNFRSTYGIETKPFGSYRLKILEIISILIKIGKPFDFMSIFCKNKIFSFLMEISMKYEFNSFLHNLCEKIVIIGIETENEEILNSLLIESNLTKILIEGITKKEILTNNDRIVQRGYKAFFIRIANFLVKIINSNVIISELLQKDENWKNFVNNELANINSLQTQELGGHNPKKSPQIEEDDNYKIEIDIKKIYEKFSQYFQNGPMKEKKDDLEHELEDDFEKESPEYGSPEKKQEEDEDIPEIIEKTNNNSDPEKKEKEFISSNFWKTSIAYDLEELSKDL